MFCFKLTAMCGIHKIMFVCPGAQDDGGPGGCREGEALSAPAEGDTVGSGLTRLPTSHGGSTWRPLPHQGGLQRDRWEGSYFLNMLSVVFALISLSVYHFIVSTLCVTVCLVHFSDVLPILSLLRPAVFTADVRGAMHLQWKLRGIMIVYNFRNAVCNVCNKVLNVYIIFFTYN